ncbi:hypothetical protein AA313_de0209672 [Arthrobotrys entomopaga]|nr:hypothetical protein AA313_de0209672 [Arthrobotrys entomopaga]
MVHVGLSAVVPKWVLILNGNLEDLGVLAVLGNKVEAGEEGSVADWVAGVGKVGLSDGVVARGEVEFDNVADFGDNVFRVEVETTAADDDRVGCTSWGDTGVVSDGFIGLGWGCGNSRADSSQSSSENGERLSAEHFEIYYIYY